MTGGPLDNNSRLKSHLTFGGSIFLCTCLQSNHQTQCHTDYYHTQFFSTFQNMRSLHLQRQRHTFIFLTDSYPFIHGKSNAHNIGGTSRHFDHHLLKDTWVPEGAWQSLNPEQICEEKLCVETLNFDHHLLEDRWVTEGAWQSPNPVQICEAKLCLDTLNFDHHLLEDRWVPEVD